jgi:hypothetical protein
MKTDEKILTKEWLIENGFIQHCNFDIGYNSRKWTKDGLHGFYLLRYSNKEPFQLRVEGTSGFDSVFISYVNYVKQLKAFCLGLKVLYTKGK